MNIAELLDQYGSAITRAVVDAYPPLYDAEARRAASPHLRRLLRRPLAAQADAINATVLSLNRQPGTIVVGEMGTGKSYIAAAAAYLAGCRRILVLAPPHLVKKWRREIVQTVPGAQTTIVRTVADLEGVRQREAAIHFVICSRERAKLSYRWMPAVVERRARSAGERLTRADDGRTDSMLCCPTCFAPATDDEDVPLGWTDLRVKRRRCRACGGPLWQADRTGPRRVALADYIRDRMPRFFDVAILDEGHEYKARGSAQGLAAEALADACGKTLTLTGTIFGGYSSTLFYLLWRFSPTLRREFGYRDETKWVGRFGVVERIRRKDPDAYGDDGRLSKRRNYLTRTVEKPGISPAVLFHLIGNTVFLRLSDVARSLPSYTERVAVCALDRGDDPEAPSQASCYQRLASELRQATCAALCAGSKRLLAAYLQALLAYPDACTRGETVLDPATGSVIGEAPALPEERLYPKERALVDLALRERGRGRRLLVYITHTERRDLSPRLRTVLDRAGVQTAVLKSDTVAADRREEWLSARVGEGVDVLICHPRLVQTGLDLLDWPSICWFEAEYSVYVMRQASRRSWRIGQQQPVEVTFMVYERTLQAEALALVAAKMRSALMIEGELHEDGLAALEGDDQDMLLALAHRLTEEHADDGHSLEALFARRHEAETEEESYLVPGDWDAVKVSTASAGIGSIPDLLPCQVTEPTTGERDGDTGAATGRWPSFDELARLIRRPKARRRPVPDMQLPLFDE
ncbi:MAG: DEAD/DEAH box helicase family protein [Chloroflexota bacterium]